MSSGSAPLSAEVHEYLKVCFSCDVIQGVRLSVGFALTIVWYDGGMSIASFWLVLILRPLELVPKGKPKCLVLLLIARIPWDVRAVGTCGQIQPCNDIKLVDVPEMGVSRSF